jgi:hypothetical protein
MPLEIRLVMMLPMSSPEVATASAGTAPPVMRLTICPRTTPPIAPAEAGFLQSCARSIAADRTRDELNDNRYNFHESPSLFCGC